MRDMFELFSRLDKQPTPVVVRYESVMPERPNGPQFAIPVVVDAIESEDGAEAMPDRPGKYKPAGLPSVPDMITTTLQAVGPGGLQTKQIAEFIRQKWWPEITAGRVTCIAWSMKRRGLIEKRGQRYRIKPNGHAQESTKETRLAV